MTNQNNSQNAEAFNALVDGVILAVHEKNREFLEEGTSVIAVALANAMTTADLLAALAGGSESTLDGIMASIATDMKARALAALKHHAEHVAEAA